MTVFPVWLISESRTVTTPRSGLDLDSRLVCRNVSNVNILAMYTSERKVHGQPRTSDRLGAG
jgi:hypothetical protein